MFMSFFFKLYCDHRNLHSFPTRRSSDLQGTEAELADVDGVGGVAASALPTPQTVQFLHRAVSIGRGFEPRVLDRKSTRLNSSHDQISYAVFCLKKKNR